MTIFEATATLDAGPIYLQKIIELQGIELVHERRALQARANICLCLEGLDRYTEEIGQSRHKQGQASHYQRRRPADSQLATMRSLVEQLNLLHIVDNLGYPAFIEREVRRFDMHLRPAAEINQSASSPSPTV